ncbi:STAS domain-containing protein [Actinoplanes sp. NPDC048967]|uniref:STAS domain-containing protein n=1 Tax=Actinoplanes sp. NPDC048967 TaxID=3155269 RepID=UPI0033D54EAE
MSILVTPTRSCAVSTVRLAVTGDLDMATVAAVSATFDAVAATRPDCVLVELNRCAFLDAAGVSCLLRAQTRLRHDGGRLVLLDPTPLVHRVLQVCRAAHLVEMRGTGHRS